MLLHVVESQPSVFRRTGRNKTYKNEPGYLGPMFVSFSAFEIDGM